jgi:large subunit ribosomal protein L17
MRHRVAHRKLGRVTEHRISMLRNQATALIQHEHVETTVPRAKELRPFVERLITVARRSLGAGEGSSKGVTARRVVARDIADKDIVRKLFDTIAPRFAERPGGYTRLLRVGYRRGDSAELALVELIGSEYDPNAEVEAAKAEGGDDKPKKKTVGGRLREALGGGRKKKDDADEGRKGKASVSRASKGAAKKVTTPRKAGGS